MRRLFDYIGKVIFILFASISAMMVSILLVVMGSALYHMILVILGKAPQI